MNIVKSDTVFIVDKNKLVDSTWTVKSVTNGMATILCQTGSILTVPVSMLITDDDAARLFRSVPRHLIHRARYSYTDNQGWTVSY